MEQDKLNDELKIRVTIKILKCHCSQIKYKVRYYQIGM